MESSDRDREELRPDDVKRRLREEPGMEREPEDTGGHPEEDVWGSPDPPKDPGPVHDPPGVGEKSDESD